MSKKRAMDYLTGKHLSLPLVSILLNAYRFLLFAVALTAAILVLGGDVLAVLTGAFALLLFASFLAKENIENMVGAIILYWDKPFLTGDFISVEKLFGKIIEITLFSTRLKNARGEIISLPNAWLLQQKIVNHSSKGILRVDVPLQISYAEDIELTKKILLELVKNNKSIKQEPRAEVVVERVSKEGVNLSLRVWTDQIAREKRLSFELLEKAVRALEEKGIEMPLAHHTHLLEKHGIETRKKKKQ
jgi:small conductance mechanosensitive channel